MELSRGKSHYIARSKSLFTEEVTSCGGRWRVGRRPHSAARRGTYKSVKKDYQKCHNVGHFPFLLGKIVVVSLFGQRISFDSPYRELLLYVYCILRFVAAISYPYKFE
jgi:hypothetical protein